jgi:hypothetical protein
LQNFDSGQTFLKADNSSACNQLQGAFVIELGGPTDREFEAPSGKHHVLGSEEYTVAGDVYRLAVAGFFARSLVQELVTDFALDRESIGVTPIGLFLPL